MYRSNFSLGTGDMFMNKDILLEHGRNLSTLHPYGSLSSFRISRPLQGREQLDFSSKLGPDSCGRLLRSYWPLNSPGKGNDKMGDLEVQLHQHFLELARKMRFS
jgi:hypothetical protein